VFLILGDLLWISEYDILFSSAKYNLQDIQISRVLGWFDSQ